VFGRVSSHPELFGKFKGCVNKPDFEETLKKAESDPMGDEARELMKTVLPFITLSGGKVSWGTQERRKEFGKLMALQQVQGAGNNWLSIAPNTVHDINAIRLSHGCTAPLNCGRTPEDTRFPAATPQDFLKSLRDRTEYKERPVVLPPNERRLQKPLYRSGRVDCQCKSDVECKCKPKEFMCDEASLQQLAAKNPVATTLCFARVVENVMTELLGLPQQGTKKTHPLELPSKRKLDVVDGGTAVGVDQAVASSSSAYTPSPRPYVDRRVRHKGIFGQLMSTTYVIEQNKRSDPRTFTFTRSCSCSSKEIAF